MTKRCGVRISIDHDKCVGSRICVAVSSTVFALNADAQAVVMDVGGDALDNIRMAAEACPVSAISIEDDN